MRDVVVALALRTPGGRAKKGTFRQTRPDDLGAAVIRALLERAPNLDPARVGDVIVGCAMPEGEQGMNVGRNMVLLAGLPYTVPGMTVNRFCSSGLESINVAAAEIALGQVDIAIAGGVESMTLVPMGGMRYLPNPTMVAEAPGTYLNMGLTAERLAERDKIGREAQDAFAFHSHMKAVAAQQGGKFDAELVPVTTAVSDPGPTGKPVVREMVLDRDEGPRADTTMEALAKLKPAFLQGGTVTAGNASQMTDGAAAVLLTTPEIAAELKLEPLARWVGYAVAGVPPEIMGIGPVEAVPKVLKRFGLKLADMNVIELNEAFAAQSLAVVKGLGLDADDPRLNANGGAIALGHPLGCTGAKLTATALHELRRRKGRYAMVTMCIGTGMGAAGIFEAA
ncbi:MAG: acetyl-CoA C-acyltransferase [Gemmatimonadota bacterium]|nr:acetyl-CoA C-acyltransferase [Gemmatimonadota bacterium]MDH4350093.1 acetyl-CoA C-acyltransferase [Gemmatimonadota bacterium]MDH5195670.1 acetyl-CoA C-acyltransferase [Gemmatimonadota bacterium]